MATTKRPQYEKFVVKRGVPFMETMLWGLESVIYIIGGFFAGFQLKATHNLLFLLLLFIILFLRFQWKTVEEITKKVKLL